MTQQVVRISKLKVRNDLQINLPGAPITFSPLVFSSGFDVGEIGLANDTGRMFVGMQPTTGNPNYQRTTFPYQNVEILTENATQTFNRMFDTHYCEINGGFYYSIILSNSSWNDLYITNNNTTVLYTILGSHLIAQMDYFIFDNLNNPLRTGNLKIISQQGSNTALTYDENFGPDTQSPLSFSVPAITNGFKIQYSNSSGISLKLFFRLQRPIAT